MAFSETTNNSFADNGLAINDVARLTLYENGIIKECNKAGADLLGCAPNKLTRQNISTFLPGLGEVPLLEGERVNPYLRFLSRVGHQFEMISVSGAHYMSQLFFNEAENLSPHCLRIIIQPIGTQSVQS
ncbi:MAG TPA: hypothetical protein VES38_03415 [Methylotenera sp.]|nr:hypothetical protein [Methylotenera sp.]